METHFALDRGPAPVVSAISFDFGLLLLPSYVSHYADEPRIYRDLCSRGTSPARRFLVLCSLSSYAVQSRISDAVFSTDQNVI